MRQHLDIDDIYHFTVRYEHCVCQGWDEFYDGIQAPRRGFNGQLLNEKPRPNGLTLKGRSNHRRNCNGTEWWKPHKTPDCNVFTAPHADCDCGAEVP